MSKMKRREFSTGRWSGSGLEAGFKGLWGTLNGLKIARKALRIRRGAIEDNAPHRLCHEA
jgi:hypothetical protein